MDRSSLLLVADIVLFVHLGVILFNVFGLIAIPLGGWLGWRFVRAFWWRALHLASLGIVALQAVLERICFLTLWQSGLLQRAGAAASDEPLIQRWIERLIYWPLPSWMFTVMYVAVLAITVALWWLVPPRLPRRKA